MSAGQAIKQRVYQTVERLPPEGFEELIRFVDFLKFKYHIEQPERSWLWAACGRTWISM